MAQPSSSHHRDRDDDRHTSRHRSERSSHHHHRTISSTTLLLVLSLVLAVLAVMLSLPSQGASATASGESQPGLLSYLAPKRAQVLTSRENTVAEREAKVAMREAELLAGAPGGVVQSPPPPPSPIACPLPVTITQVDFLPGPTQTIIKEPETNALASWSNARMEDAIERELRIADRERDISKREEAINRREHDATRRENWINEQLLAINAAGPEVDYIVEEEPVYDAPPRRIPKVLQAPPPVVTEVYQETYTVTQTETIRLPKPSNIRVAAPVPEAVSSASSFTTASPRTTTVEITQEVFEDVPRATATVVRAGAGATRPRQPAKNAWIYGY